MDGADWPHRIHDDPAQGRRSEDIQAWSIDVFVAIQEHVEAPAPEPPFDRCNFRCLGSCPLECPVQVAVCRPVASVVFKTPRVRAWKYRKLYVGPAGCRIIFKECNHRLGSTGFIPVSAPVDKDPEAGISRPCRQGREKEVVPAPGWGNALGSRHTKAPWFHDRPANSLRDQLVIANPRANVAGQSGQPITCHICQV